MKITILNGDMQADGSGFSSYCARLAGQLQKEHTSELFNLAELDLKYCRGCWDCWWKTPGECTIKDDAGTIFRAVINADLVLFASPLRAGFTSSLLKKMTDRLIVLVHPYIELRNGECHHIKRYDRYPDMGVIVQKEGDTDDEDLGIVNDIYDRLAINFHSTVRLFQTMDGTSVKELCDAISAV